MQTRAAAGCARSKGLHPEPVTAQMQTPRGSVPEREGKHAAKARNGCKPPLRIGDEDDFSVRVALELMMKLLEFATNLAKIVNFPVVHDPESAALGLHRLMSQGRQIDNRKSSVTQHRSAVRNGMHTTVVRATVF